MSDENTMQEEVTEQIPPEQTDIIERNKVISSITPQIKANLAKVVLDSSARGDSSETETPSFDNSDLAEFIYNRKIPEIYRIADDEISTDRDLNRFLHVGIDGGLGDTISKIANLKTLVDPLTCPPQFLPMLASSWGLPYFEEIGVYSNRKFLSCIGEFMKRRSTMGGVKYIIRVLTGFDTDLEYERVSEGEKQGRFLRYTLRPSSIKALDRLGVSEKALSHFIQRNIPFYITVDYKGVVVLQSEELKSITRKNGFCLSSNYHYDFTKGAMKRETKCYTYPIFSINKAPHYDLSAIQ